MDLLVVKYCDLIKRQKLIILVLSSFILFL